MVESFHYKCTLSKTQPSQISIKVGKLVDSIENSTVLLQNFSILCLEVSVVQGCENQKKNAFFWHAAFTKNYHNF
jgi:hypothetical protein